MDSDTKPAARGQTYKSVTEENDSILDDEEVVTEDD